METINIEKKEMSFLKRSACELTGQPSSKRVTAYAYALAGIIIILTICGIAIFSEITKTALPGGVSDILHFLGTEVLWAVILFVAAVFGINMSQNKAAINKGIVTDLNAVIPPDPAPQQ